MNRTHTVSMGVLMAERASVHPRFQAIMDEQTKAEQRVLDEAKPLAPLAVLTGNTLEMGTVTELGRALARLGIPTEPKWVKDERGIIAGIRLIEVAS